VAPVSLSCAVAGQGFENSIGAARGRFCLLGHQGQCEMKRGAQDGLAPGDYEVGYGKPPLRTRFRKGQSGNPGGRPRGMTAARANMLVLKEAYRSITLREGDNVFTLPAIQVVLRSQIAKAAKGNGPAQRAVIEAVQAIEQELAAQLASKERARATERPISDLDAARRIAFALEKGRREIEARGVR
jgi:hypothetical protein